MACLHCERDVRIEGHGYCSACYSRLQRHGRLERVNVVNKGKSCSYPECEKAAFSKGLCQYHYDNSKHDLHQIWALRKSRGDIDPNWDRFEVFLEDVGERPSKKHQLRRIDKSKPYSKENVQWLEPIPYKSGTWEYTRDHQLRTMFDLSIELFNEILAEQGGVCAICRQPEIRLGKGGKLRDFCVDHNHSTGKVRGLLCAECNSGLGNFKDSITILQSAITYLQSHAVKPKVQKLKLQPNVDLDTELYYQEIPMLMPNQRENMVRERAHKLWTEAEEPEGQDQMFWDRASKEIDAEESFGADYLTRMEEEDARRKEEEKSNVTDEDRAKREAEARQALAEQNRGRDPEQVRRERETTPPPPHRELTGEADNAGKHEQQKRDTKAQDDKKVEKEALEREPVENSLKEESHRHQQHRS